MAIHSSTLVWKIPWTEEPDRLRSMGSQRVGHDWATSLSLSFTFQMMKLPSCNSQGLVLLEHTRSLSDKIVFGVYEKKRFYILSDSFLFWRLSHLLHDVVDTLRIWCFLKQRFQIWDNQLLKQTNQRCQWPNTKEVCLSICNRSWLGLVFFPMVIQGPKSLLTWISIIPSLLLGTGRGWRGHSSHQWEPFMWSYLTLAWTGNHSPCDLLPTGDNLTGGMGGGGIWRAAGLLGYTWVTLLLLTSEQPA